jgi:oxygen-independent coproporphyrinogen III oxidase
MEDPEIRDSNFEIHPSHGLYVHVPFCLKRCPYCAFVLIESDGSLHSRFVDVIEKQLRETKGDAATLYFGGGTPSMLSPEQIARLIVPAGEITLEANPDGLGLERLRSFREAGINRLSLGIQSTRPAHLEFLGRTHDPRQAREAFHAARAAGFRNVSIDLIFGAPGQTVDDWKRELEEWAIADHISVYGLTVEPGTALERDIKKGAVVPGDEAQRDLYVAAMELLPGLGFRQYELSNFAKPGFESRHNLGYWEGRPYFGFGPGAHSYAAPRRWANLANVAQFIERAERGEPVVATEETLTAEQQMLEAVFLGLRRTEGLFVPGFDERFGLSFEERHGALAGELAGDGLLERRGGFLALTMRGKLLADSVIGRFA